MSELIITKNSIISKTSNETSSCTIIMDGNGTDFKLEITKKEV